MGRVRSVAAARTVRRWARAEAARPARRVLVRSTLAQRLWEAIAEVILSSKGVRICGVDRRARTGEREWSGRRRENKKNMKNNRVTSGRQLQKRWRARREILIHHPGVSEPFMAEERPFFCLPPAFFRFSFEVPVQGVIVCVS